MTMVNSKKGRKSGRQAELRIHPTQEVRRKEPDYFGIRSSGYDDRAESARQRVAEDGGRVDYRVVIMALLRAVSGGNSSCRKRHVVDRGAFACYIIIKDRSADISRV